MHRRKNTTIDTPNYVRTQSTLLRSEKQGVTTAGLGPATKTKTRIRSGVRTHVKKQINAQTMTEVRWLGDPIFSFISS